MSNADAMRRMIADRAARTRRAAFYTTRVEEMRRRQHTARAALPTPANDDQAPAPARAVRRGDPR